MARLLLTALVLLLPATSLFATRVSNVYVDMLKGYAQNVNESGDTVRYYSGRVQYQFFAESNDSFWVDFLITPPGSHDYLEVIEKSGAIGFVRQRNGSDTLKTGYFRVKTVGEQSGEFVGTVVINAEKSRLNAMADSLVGLMTNEQKQSLTYTSSSHPIYKDFGQDDITLPDGTVIVGWRCADGPHGIRYPLGPKNEYAI